MIRNSLLARTFLLLAALVILTTAAWLILFRHIEAEPRARESAQLAASAVNLIRAALFAAAPERRPGLFTELSTREGVRLLPAEADDRVEPMPDSRFHRLMQRELQTRLGPGTRIASEVDGVPGFWVSFRLDDADDEEYWLALPSERAARAIARHWLLWGLLALGLALAVAWLIASRLSRPLRALARSADAVGRGQRPDPLPETGAEEMRLLAAAFNAMAGDLARHDRERSEVLAGLSHDLRTPLTRLRLEAEMSISDDAARAAVVADIGQMEGVIGQFMDYARTDDGEEAAATDLGALLDGIAAHQHRIGRPLALELAPLPPLPLRPQALARAVTNLVDNAARYGAGEIRVSGRQAGQEIHIEVADRGPGIPPAETERLKRPFTRLDAARSNATGTGLGLAIVDRVARLHGGRLELLENPGGGLLARLVLPLA
jgi:two-component system osmolarity sensor histidine kinase EnvZ